MPLEQTVEGAEQDTLEARANNGSIFYNGRKVEQEIHITARDIYGIMGALFSNFWKKKLTVDSIDIDPSSATVTVYTRDSKGHKFRGDGINRLPHVYRGLREIGISYHASIK